MPIRYTHLLSGVLLVLILCVSLLFVATVTADSHDGEQASEGQENSDIDPNCPSCITAPPAPTGVNATSTGQTSVRVSWNTRIGFAKYRLDYKPSTASTWTIASLSITTSPYTVTALQCNTSYNFRVKAFGDGDDYTETWGEWSSTSDATTSTCPDAPAPGGLHVTADTVSSVSLSWNAVTDAYRYKLERRLGTSGSWQTVSSTISGTTAVASGLECNTTYYFRVSARGDGNPLSTTFGDVSSSVSRTTSTCPDAPAPGGLHVTADTVSSVSLSWNAVTDAYRYKLERRLGTSGSWQTVSSTISGTTAVASGLECNTTYYFRVSARGDGSPLSTTFGNVSSSVSRTTSTCPDAPTPGGLHVTGDTVSSVSLSWNAVTDAYRYKLERRLGTSGSWQTVSSTISGTTAVASGLECNTTYYFRVSARGDGNPLSTTFGDVSSSVSRTTSTCPDAPTPGGLHVTGDTVSSVSLSWNAVTDAYRYKLERRLGTSGSWQTVSSTISGTTAVASGLECNTTYYFRVSARGDGSPLSTTFGNVSSSVSRTTSTCPGAPAPGNFTATATGTTTISVSWDPVTGATKYLLEYLGFEALRDPTQPDWIEIDTYTSAGTRTITGLSPGTEYPLRVRAYGDGTTYETDWGEAATFTVSTNLDSPPAPTGFIAAATARYGIDLEWDTQDGIDRYRVEYSTDGTAWTLSSDTITGSSTSHAVSGLECDVSYQFRISAYGDGIDYAQAWSPTSSHTDSTDLCLPPAPGNFTATATGTTTISVSWDPVTGATKYLLEYLGFEALRDPTQPDWIEIDTYTSAGTRTITGLSPGTEYPLRVRAYGDGTTYETDWGEAATFTVSTNLDSPPAPTGFIAAATARYGIDLEWDTQDGIDRYRVEYSTDGTAWTLSSDTITGSSTSHAVSGLECDVSYQFRISAYGDGIDYAQAWSPTSSHTDSTDLCLPPAPGNFTATATGTTTISVSWDPVTGATKYLLEYLGFEALRDPTQPDWIEIDTYTSAGTRTITGLSPGTEYPLRVRAYGDGTTYETDWGEAATFTVSTNLDSPPAPTGFIAAATARYGIDLEWDTQDGIDRYRVEYSTDGTAWTLSSDTITGSSTSHAVSGLECDVSYQFRISAYGDGIDYAQAWSPTSSHTDSTDLCLPPAPGNFTATATGTTTISVSWDPVTGATKYLLEYLGFEALKDPTQPDWIEIDTYTSAGTRTITGLSPGTEYPLRVRAYGDGTTYETDWGEAATFTVSTNLEELEPPSNLNLSIEAGDDNNLDLGYTQSSESTHYYQFELESSDAETGTYSLAATNDDSTASPAHFDDVDQGLWYRARGRNCQTASRTDCGPWSQWSPALEVPVTIEPPSNLNLSIEAGDDNNLDLGYTQSSESTHYYQFELESSDMETGTYSLAATNDDSTASPAHFDDVDQGLWYRARGRNCQTASRTDCGPWSQWSPALEVPVTIEPPTEISVAACSNGVVIPDAATNQELVGDCESLVKIIDALRGNTPIFLNWGTHNAITTWEGVIISSVQDPQSGQATDRITELDLSDYYLSGSIPTELGSLTSLTSLDLGGNTLSGSIPTELGSLTGLTSLDLSGNQLSGSIPTELGSLTGLTYLDLGGNELSGSIPTELGSVTSLTSLDLGSNELSGSIPTELGSLTSLTSLDLSGNDLSDSIPTELGSLTSLTYLDLGGNELWGFIPTELGSLTSLTYLDLGGNTLSDSIPTELGSLTGLTSLDLSDNFLWSTIPTELGSLTSLTSLDLGGNTLSGSIPTELGSLTGLTSLDLSHNQLSGSIPTEFGSLSSLSFLDLSYNSLSGPIPTELGSLTSLAILDLSYNFLSGALPTELGNLTSLDYLDLSYNTLSGIIPTELGSLTSLEYLDLSYNALSDPIPAELGSLSSLRHLNLNYNFISGLIPTELGNLTNLTYMDLSYNNLSGQIPGTFSNLTSLTTLYLAGNSLTGCIPATIPYTTDNDLDSLGLLVCVTIDVDVSDPVLGQTVTLTATANAPSSSVLSYQWQEYSGGTWTNHSSTSATLSESSSTETTRTFKIIASIDATPWEESVALTIRWRPIAVYIDIGEDLFPSPEDNVTLTAVTTESHNATLTYRWQQWLDGDWTNLASSTNQQIVSADEEERQDQTEQVRGTKRYKVTITYNNSESSAETHVTWGEIPIVSEMFADLQSAVETSPSYITAQSALLACMNKDLAASDQYTSFDDILDDYTDDISSKMDEGGLCHAQAYVMFSAVETQYQQQLMNLKANNSEYSALLDTAYGREFTERVGDRETLELLGRLLASRPEQLSSGTPSRNPYQPLGTGLDCVPLPIPLAYQESNVDLRTKIDVLNCLLIRTSNTFWNDSRSTEELESRVVDGPYTWLGWGDSVCSPEVPLINLNPDFAVPNDYACLKHDLAYSSLVKFEGTVGSSELDRAWNARNRVVADNLWVLDMQCRNITDTSQCIQNSALIRTYNEVRRIFYEVTGHSFVNITDAWAQTVALVQRFGWDFSERLPVTSHDIEHAKANPEFISCDPPRVVFGPLERENTASRRVHSSFVFRPGCVDDVTINSVDVTWQLEYGHWAYTDRSIDDIFPARMDTATASYDAGQYHPYEALFSVSIVGVQFIPNDLEFGGLWTAPQPVSQSLLFQ